MYRYEEVEVFRALISQCNQNRTIAINGNGERKIPPSMANNLLEHVNSNYMFPRPRREVYSKRNFFPKTRVQEKILYKKPPFTLRNQPKFHSQSPLPAGYSGQGLVPNTYARVVSQSTPRASYHAAPQVAYQSGPAQVQYAGAPVAQPSVLSQPGTNVGKPSSRRPYREAR